MPGLDSTGPMGQGAQTGRKLGNCNSGTDSVVEGTPRGRGRGLGRVFKNANNSEFGARLGRGRRGLGRGFGRNANR